MSYVESYLTNVERQIDGWPVGVSDKDKAELVAITKEVVERFPDGLFLYQIVDRVLYRKPQALEKVVIIDYQYACVHRALLVVKAVEVWQPKQVYETRTTGKKAKLISDEQGEVIRNGEKGTGKVLWSMRYIDVELPIWSLRSVSRQEIVRKERCRWMKLNGWMWYQAEDIKNGVMQHGVD